ncbi:hypothetical protein DM860_012669 [Cuscuta australis]|uniref:RING-type domain-containing protein n=1 Tax=Cuscuta australis TaxID=267555 RepID=A0A328DG47_9ASTE|nr:hypothetical protein DM860_012669 [Cuscuta australis]
MTRDISKEAITELEAVDDGSNEILLTISTTENGSRNKRKFLSEFPLDIQIDSPPLSLTEFPRYELLEEKLRSTLHTFASLNLLPDQTNDTAGAETSQEADWDDPIACELEKLLTHNLHATFQTAVKKIVECGYSQEIAESVVLRSGLYHGIKDAVSNVVDGALDLLTKEKNLGTRYQLFEEFDSLVEYAILEMICVLREIKPFLTVAEAMWALLICDLNLLHACAVKADLSCDFFNQVVNPEASKASSNQEKSNLSNKSVPFPTVPQLLKYSQFRDATISSKEGGSFSLLEMESKSLGAAREYIQAVTQAVVSEEKSGVSRKGCSLHSKKDLLRQKPFPFEKTYKGRLGKGSFKAKITSWGSMVLDKTLNAQTGSSSTTSSKGTYSKTTITTKSTPASNSALPISGNDTSVQDPVVALPPVSTYYADIPYDDSLGKYIPRDEKDEAVLMLVPHLQKLEKEIQGWIDWANEKVMQATRRLAKDQAELRMLREERDEAEKFQRDKHTLEENTVKRLSEMEHALSNAGGQMETATSYLQRLEAEHAVLIKKMEAATFLSMESSRKLQEAMAREQEGLKKCQSWEVEKSLFQEELTALKCECADIQLQVEKGMKRLNQIEDLYEEKRKEKEGLLMQVGSLRGETEQLGALAKAEEDRIRDMAGKNMQKRKSEIDKIGSEISWLRLESEASKLEELRRGVGKLGLQNQATNQRLAEGNVKPERECVMCLAEEVMVVFLPCAHQVLCAQCNVLHEKKGMADCPSCRTPIKERIEVLYPSPL